MLQVMFRLLHMKYCRQGHSSILILGEFVKGIIPQLTSHFFVASTQVVPVGQLQVLVTGSCVVPVGQMQPDTDVAKIILVWLAVRVTLGAGHSQYIVA